MSSDGRRLLCASGALLAFSLSCGAAPQNSIFISSLSKKSQPGRPFSISRVFAPGEISNFAQARVKEALLPTQCDVKTRWPDGSLQHAIVSFIADVPAAGKLVVEFINQTDGGNPGGLDKTGMLAQDWQASIELVSRDSVQSIDARRIITDWTGGAADGRLAYWLFGRVCTQVILQDSSPTLAYDMGWDQYKSLHPIFVVTFYPGTQAGVKVEMILENEWSTKLQDQSYALTLRSHGDVVYSKPTFTHYARTRWRKVYWSGPEPAPVKIDYNLPYLEYTKVIPNYDLSKSVPGSAVSEDVNSFKRSDHGDINGNGLWTKFMPETGGRPDLGLLPAWYVRYLYTFDPGEYAVMLGNGAAAASVPIHVRESATSLFYDSAGQVPAFGWSFSLNARPKERIQDLSSLSPLSSANGWTPDIAHVGNFAYIPYLITGDWYFLDEMFQFASWAIGLSDPSMTEGYARHGSWGLLTNAIQTRGVAWATRDLAETAFMAPDTVPQKRYFTEILANNIAAWEGAQNITNGAFYDPAPGSKWSWGRIGIAKNANNPLHFPDLGDEYASKDGMDTSPANPSMVQVVGEPWEYNYLHVVLGHVAELSFPITQVQRTLAKNLLNQLANPAYNPYLAGMYRMPVICAFTKTYYTDWSSVKEAFEPKVRNTKAWLDNGDENVSSGYPHIARAAASFLPGIEDGTLSGQAAWNWINAHVGHQDLLGTDPSWAIVPR